MRLSVPIIAFGLAMILVLAPFLVLDAAVPPFALAADTSTFEWLGGEQRPEPTVDWHSCAIPARAPPVLS